MIKYILISFVFTINLFGGHCQSLGDFTFVGCYKSSNTWDAFKESLTEQECKTAAGSVLNGVCFTGNCDSWQNSYACSSAQCLRSACSKYYYKVNSAKMTNEMCTHICITILKYAYAGTNQG